MKERISLLWKITKNIDKKFFGDNLFLSKIVFFKKMPIKNKSCGAVQGYYDVHKKEIGIKEDLSLIEQIDNLCHELAHAYQSQILGHKGRHDKIGGKIYKSFLKETDCLIKFE